MSLSGNENAQELHQLMRIVIEVIIAGAVLGCTGAVFHSAVPIVAFLTGFILLLDMIRLAQPNILLISICLVAIAILSALSAWLFQSLLCILPLSNLNENLAPMIVSNCTLNAINATAFGSGLFMVIVAISFLIIGLSARR